MIVLKATTLLTALVSLGAAAQTQDVADRIVGAAVNRRGAISFLETLTDTVGGRVTGSPEARAASELILKTLRATVLRRVLAERCGYYVLPYRGDSVLR